jgi:hypothetical protein
MPKFSQPSDHSESSAATEQDDEGDSQSEGLLEKLEIAGTLIAMAYYILKFILALLSSP